jgi:hypothetical protein
METTKATFPRGALLITGGLVGAALISRLFLSNANAAMLLGLSQLVNPQAVKPISDQIDGTGDEAVLGDWQYAGQNITYKYFGTEMHFYDHTVSCLGCLLPMQVASLGESNCVGKSILLASLLRNRYSADDVYVVVGEYVKLTSPPKDRGHAWVILRKNGGPWYLLEATMPPPVSNPWITANEVSDIYIPYVWFNDQGMTCYNAELCTINVSISTRPCCHCGAC